MINNDIKSIKEFTNKIHGWLTDREGEFLYKIAKKCSGQGVIVEIGSWKGKSTIWLGKGSIAGNNVKVYAIDPHTGSSEHKKSGKGVWTFEKFKENIKDAGVNDVIISIVETSEKAVKEWNIPVEFIFIDGAHEIEFVEKDFLLWFPHIIDGGIIAIHDTTSCFRYLLPGWPGPKKVAERFIFKSRNFKDVGLIDTITYGTKCKENSLKDKIKIKCVRFKKYVPDFIHLLLRNESKIPRPIKSIGKVLLKLI